MGDRHRQAPARTTQTYIGVDKNTTVVFPAPLMSTIGELGAFLARESAAAGGDGVPSIVPGPEVAGPGPYDDDHPAHNGRPLVT
jgi:hypothetical protein